MRSDKMRGMLLADPDALFTKEKKIGKEKGLNQPNSGL